MTGALPRFAKSNFGRRARRGPRLCHDRHYRQGGAGLRHADQLEIIIKGAINGHYFRRSLAGVMRTLPGLLESPFWTLTGVADCVHQLLEWNPLGVRAQPVV